MAIVLSTGFAPELLWPGINAIYGISYNKYDTKYTQFFETKTSDKAFEKDQGMTGFPLAAVKEQGNEAYFTQMYQGYQREYNHLTYSIGAVITREMVEDDQYNVIKQIPRLLGESMRQTEEVVSTQILNSAFDSTYTGSDGVSLCSTAHPLVGGSTGTNTPATAADLTQTSFEQGIIDVMDIRDEQGLRINVEVKTLVVPRSLYFTGTKLLNTKFEVGSANNAINVLADMNIKLVATNYLTDQDAWFLQTNVKNGLTFFQRRAAELDRDNDFNTDNLKIKTSQRFSVGWTDWRNIYGSPGA